jgi:hypothetical protein
MPRVRPRELKAVVKLLDSPAESVEQLAADVIVAIDELRAERTDYVTVVRHSVDPPFFMVYGPYITAKAAEKDIGNNVIASRPGVRYMVLPLTTEVEEGVEVDALF